MKKKLFNLLLLLLIPLFLISCSGDDGAVGPAGSAITFQGFSIQGSVVDSNGIAISGATVNIGSNGSIQSTTTSDSGVYTFMNLEGSRWQDVDQSGAWSNGDTIDGTYTISVTVSDANHNTTAVIRDAMVGAVVNTSKGTSEDWFPNGTAGQIDTFFECTGTRLNIDDEATANVNPVDLDGDGVIGINGTCQKTTNNAEDNFVNTDKAVSEDRNGNGVLDIYTNGLSVNIGTNNYDFIIPENNSSLVATIVDAQTLQALDSATITLERIDTGFDPNLEYRCSLLNSGGGAGGKDAQNSFSVPLVTTTSGTDGSFTLTGLVSADCDCDGDYDATNIVTVSAPGYQTIQFQSTNPVNPRKIYSLGHFQSNFPGDTNAGIIYMVKTFGVEDTTAPYVTGVSFDTTSIVDGYITTTVPSAIRIVFNEALIRNIDGIYQNGVITKVDFAGGDYTTDDFSMQDVAAKINYEESTTGSGTYDTLVVTPQMALEAGFRYRITLTAAGIGVMDMAGNAYLGFVDVDSDGAFDCDQGGAVPSDQSHSWSGESPDFLNYNTTCAGANLGILDFTINQATPTYTPSTVVASNADTGPVRTVNGEYVENDVDVEVEPNEGTFIDWSPWIDASGNQAYGYRIWGQAVNTTGATEITIGPWVELAEINLSYNPDTEFTWVAAAGLSTFWADWELALQDTSTIGNYALYSLENEAQGSDPWTLMEMDIKIGGIDINGLEGAQSTAIRVEDNTPPRIGRPVPELTAANRNYPFARVTLREDAEPDTAPANISTIAAAYTDEASSNNAFGLIAERDEYRANDTSTQHSLKIKFSEPLMDTTVNVDANTDGIGDNITLAMVNSGFESTNLSTADSTLYYGATAVIPSILAFDGNDVDVDSDSDGTSDFYVNYGTSSLFNMWPGVDVNDDTELEAATKYQMISLDLDDIFNVRTGLGVQLGTGITDLHGNAVPSNQKIAYLVDGIPPVVKDISLSIAGDYIQVTFTEPVNITTITGGLALNAQATASGLALDTNNPTLISTEAGYTRIEESAYKYDATQTIVRIYVNDLSLLPYNAAGRLLVTNTLVEDLAPTVFRYDGSNDITGANTVQDDLIGTDNSDSGTYLDAYATLNGVNDVAGYIEKVGPRIAATTNGAAITPTGGTAIDEMHLDPTSVTISYTEAMNNSVDMYGDDFATSICNPANYTVNYATGSTTGAAGSATAFIKQVTCTSTTSVDLVLSKSFTGTVDYTVAGGNVVADTAQGERIQELVPLTDGFGGLTLTGFSVDTSGIQRDASTTAMTNVTARHYIVPATYDRDFGGGYYVDDGVAVITMVVNFYTSEIDPDGDGSNVNVFELQTGGTDTGSIVHMGHYTIPSTYEIASLQSTAPVAHENGQEVTVTITLHKAVAGAATYSAAGADNSLVSITYATSTTPFNNDTLSLTQTTGNSIVVANVVDAQDNVIDANLAARSTYTWTYRADSGEDHNDDLDIVPGFHSLRKDR